MKKIRFAVCLPALLFLLPLFAAANPPRAVHALHPEFYDQIFEISLSGSAIDKESLTELAVNPGSVLRIALVGSGGDLFLDQYGDFIRTADVTASRLRAADASVFVEVYEGGRMLESAELVIENRADTAPCPVIELRFARQTESLVPAVFTFSVFVTLDGEIQPQTELAVSGIFYNEELMVYAGDTTAAPGGAVIVGADSGPSLAIDAGGGVLVTASVKKDGRYRVVAEQGETTDGALFSGAEVSGSVSLACEGFDENDVESVVIDAEEELYVYDSDGVWLGMTGTPLPLRPAYYLAPGRLEL